MIVASLLLLPHSCLHLMSCLPVNRVPVVDLAPARLSQPHPLAHAQLSLIIANTLKEEGTSNVVASAFVCCVHLLTNHCLFEVVIRMETLIE